jgi:hypothetical protein
MVPPEFWKRRKEEREKLNTDERKLKALEDMADTLVSLQSQILELKVQLTQIAVNTGKK